MTTSKIAPEYISLIEEWANKRNIINGADAKSQFFKLVSELGEWATGVLTADRDEVIDGIGDAFVVSTIIARQLGSDIIAEYNAATSTNLPGADLSLLAFVGRLGDNLAKGQTESALANLGRLADALERTATRYGLDINQCLSRAYSDIKDRTGVMYNGVFVKSTDEAYESIMASLAPAPEPVVAKFGE